jgi:uncharacterized protein (DUF608 family)
MHGGRGKKERMKKNIYSTRFCLKMMIFTNQHRTEKKIFKNSCPVNVKFQNFWRNCTFFFLFSFFVFLTSIRHVYFISTHTHTNTSERKKKDYVDETGVMCAALPMHVLVLENEWPNARREKYSRAKRFEILRQLLT